jgi:hypothetical protein
MNGVTYISSGRPTRNQPPLPLNQALEAFDEAKH